MVCDMEMLCNLRGHSRCNLNIGNRTLVGCILEHVRNLVQLNQMAILCTILLQCLTPPDDWSMPHFHLYLQRIKEQSRKAPCERTLSPFFLLLYLFPLLLYSYPCTYHSFHNPHHHPTYFSTPFYYFPHPDQKPLFPLNLEINFSSKLFPCSKRPLCFRLPNHFYL